MDRVFSHICWELVQEGCSLATVEDAVFFPASILAGPRLLLFLAQAEPSVELVQGWLWQCYDNMPPGVEQVVLVSAWGSPVTPEFQAYLGKAPLAGMLKTTATAVALDLTTRTVLGKWDLRESGGLSKILSRALKNYRPEQAFGLEELRQRHRVLAEESAATAQDLLRVTPWVTRVILALCLAVFGVTTIAGGSSDAWTLFRFGASYAPLDNQGQWWRWGSAMFMHIGAFHLLANMFSLYVVGPTLERILGNLGYAALYAVSGLTGGLISAHFGTSGLTAGASGALFGLFGAGLWIDHYWKKELPSRLRRALVGGMGPTILLNLVIGFSSSFINNAAHLGGLLGGLAFMLLTTRLGARRLRHRDLRLPVTGLLGLLALLPPLTLAWALSQAVRYPTPASYPTGLVEPPDCPYRLRLPLFMHPRVLRGQTSYVGFNYVWLNNFSTFNPLGPPPDLTRELERDVLILELEQKGKQRVVHHEVVSVAGADWLLLKIDYGKKKIGHMAVRTVPPYLLMPISSSLEDHEATARELLLSVLGSIEVKPARR